MNRFPFEAPNVCFSPPGPSPYHPNVDREGRICLDLLKLPPAGTWRPTITLISVITALRVLLVEPNPDDPLIPEIVLVST